MHRAGREIAPPAVRFVACMWCGVLVCLSRRFACRAARLVPRLPANMTRGRTHACPHLQPAQPRVEPLLAQPMSRAHTHMGLRIKSIILDDATMIFDYRGPCVCPPLRQSGLPASSDPEPASVCTGALARAPRTHKCRSSFLTNSTLSYRLSSPASTHDDPRAQPTCFPAPTYATSPNIRRRSAEARGTLCPTSRPHTTLYPTLNAGSRIRAWGSLSAPHLCPVAGQPRACSPPPSQGGSPRRNIVYRG